MNDLSGWLSTRVTIRNDKTRESLIWVDPSKLPYEVTGGMNYQEPTKSDLLKCVYDILSNLFKEVYGSSSPDKPGTDLQ